MAILNLCVRCKVYLSIMPGIIFHFIHDSRERFVMSFLSAELVYAKCFYDSSSIIYIFSGDIKMLSSRLKP